jgi:AhpD family alkylhydroperoxidase
MTSFSKMYGAIMGPGSLDRRLKEMVYLAVSTVNECKYCTAAHLKGGKKAGLSEHDIEDIESETNKNFSPAEQTALHYAREMTRACADEFGTREHLHQHFNDEQLVELTLVVALANFTNRFNNGLNIQVEHEMVLTSPVAR